MGSPLTTSTRPSVSFNAKTVLLLAALGATVGPLLDGLHTWSGATWYPNAQWLRSVWWCPPLFSGAAVALGMGRLMLERLLGPTARQVTSRTVGFTMTLFIVGYAFTGFGNVGEVPTAGVLLVAAALAWWKWDGTNAGVLGALGAGLGGWLVEHTLVGAGLFFHRDVLLDGVALWIPPLYFLAALAVGQLALAVSKSAGRER